MRLEVLDVKCQYMLFANHETKSCPSKYHAKVVPIHFLLKPVFVMESAFNLTQVITDRYQIFSSDSLYLLLFHFFNIYCYLWFLLVTLFPASSSNFFEPIFKLLYSIEWCSQFLHVSLSTGSSTVLQLLRNSRGGVRALEEENLSDIYLL